MYPNWRSTVEEVTIEATPDSIVKEPGTLEGLIAMGLTRANIGIQSAGSPTPNSSCCRTAPPGSSSSAPFCPVTMSSP
ncbi:hypothetical protein ACIQ9Q_25670 [Streptomyces sp. NPDC094438]|uniref:hypothetical protein n=1 Tax=Streptomyces sp. NPDC094438 TaxID=3366061 RepID=UPI00380F71DA